MLTLWQQWLSNLGISSAGSHRLRSSRRRGFQIGGLPAGHRHTVSHRQVHEQLETRQVLTFQTELTPDPTPSLPENEPTTTVIGTLTTTDGTGTISYTLPAGIQNNDLFDIINGNQLVARQSFNYETDALPNHRFTVSVHTVDSNGPTADDNITINLTDRNEAPTAVLLDKTNVDENLPAGSVVGNLTHTDPDADKTVTYSISGTDAAQFAINGTQLVTTAVFDFESKSSYSITIRATDGGLLPKDEPFTITVNDKNDTPTDIKIDGADSALVSENQPVGTIVGATGLLTATDPDNPATPQTFTFSLAAGVQDNDLFQLTGNVLKTNAIFDFETKDQYKILVRVSDQGGLFFDKQLTIDIRNFNNDPTDITLSNATIAENTGPNFTVALIGSVDDDAQYGDRQTFTLQADALGPDNAAFTISGNSLRLTNPADYEVKDFYDIYLGVTDTEGRTIDKAFRITVTNVNEAPTALNLSNSFLDENNAAHFEIGTFTTVDPDVPKTPDTFVYTLVSGAGADDNAAFQIVGDKLQAVAPFNYEVKDTFSIRVRTQDLNGTGLPLERTFTITVRNLNEQPTDIKLDGDDTAIVSENQPAGTVVGTNGLLTATDPDNPKTPQVLAFSLAAGVQDNDLFEITGNVLKTKTVFDFEVKPSYVVQITVMDQGGLSYDKLFTITIRDFSHDPTDITLTNSTLAENTAPNFTVGLLGSVDLDAQFGDRQTITFQADPLGPDNAAFAIVGNQLQLITPADYEIKDSYDIFLRVTDTEGRTFDKAFRITVTNVNETPTALNLSKTNLDENNAANFEIGTFSTVDPDVPKTSDTLVYTLVSGTGSTDNAEFRIVGDKLQARNSFNFEVKDTYKIRVRTTDLNGTGLWFEQEFTITVVNVNEQPTAIDLTNNRLNENLAANTVVGVLSTVDPDDPKTLQTFTYTLVSGPGSDDNAKFDVILQGDSRTANLVARNSFDFETQRFFRIRIKTTDNGIPSNPLSYEKEFSVFVNNQNEAPTALALSNLQISENLASGSYIGTFSTTDPDVPQTPDTFTYTLVLGSLDNDKFVIVGDSLRTNDVFDFEGKLSYQILVHVADSDNATTPADLQFTITVLDENEAPTLTVVPVANIPENAAAFLAATIEIDDKDSGQATTLNLQLLPELDGGQFSLVDLGANKYELRTTAPGLDYEAPASHQRQVRLRLTDSDGLSKSQLLTFNVTDVNEAPLDLLLSDNSFPENSPNAVVGDLSVVAVDAGATYSFSLVAGPGDDDNAAFTINSAGQLSFIGTADFENKATYSILVRATDDADGLLTIDRVFSISVQDVNDILFSFTVFGVTFPENSSGVLLATISVTDPDAGDSFSISLSDDDFAKFYVIENRIYVGTAFDFETQPTARFTVTIKDKGGLGLTAPIDFVVLDQNDGPTDLTGTPQSVPELSLPGTPVVTGLVVTDPDAVSSYTFSLLPGEDSQYFAVSGNSIVTSGLPLDFEAGTKRTFTVRATDNAGGGNPFTFDKVFTIDVTNVNEVSTSLLLSNDQIDENLPLNTTIGTFSTLDPDAGDTFVYSLVGGAGGSDNTLFNIVGNELRSSVPYNFEAKAVYSIRVQTRDVGGTGLTYEQVFTIRIKNVNEAPDSLTLTKQSVPENQLANSLVGQFNSTDPDAGSSFTYTFAAGTGDDDNALFTISGNQLLTAVGFDFENKASYSIRVQTADQGGRSFVQTFTVTITNVNETPSAITGVDPSVNENLPNVALVTLGTTDPDNDAVFTYTLIPGGDSGEFVIVGNELRVGPKGLNYESPGSHLRTVTVRSTDAGGLSTTRTFTVTVNDVNEPPTQLNLIPTTVLDTLPVVAENSPGAVVGILFTIDPDAGDSTTYSLVPGGDSAQFVIVGNELRVGGTGLNFEAPVNHLRMLTVLVTDGAGATTTLPVQVRVTNVNEAPTDITLSQNTVPELSASGTAIGQFTTTDVDAGDTYSYSLVAGSGSTDNASFTIVGNQLRTVGSFNFEVRTSYSIRVQTRDLGGSGLTFEKVFNITVTDVNETPTAINLSNNVVAEKLASGMLIGTLTATDIDAIALLAPSQFRFTLVSGSGADDNALFSIPVAASGQLLTNAVFDYEQRSTYSIRVRVTDYDPITAAPGLSFDQTFTINILDAAEDPTAIVLDSLSFTFLGGEVLPPVNENSVSAEVGTLRGTDPDAGQSATLTFAVVGGADAAEFETSGNKLMVKAGHALDYEASPIKTRTVQIRATDSTGRTFDQSFKIAVIDEPDAPTAIQLLTSTIDENRAPGSEVGILTTTDPDVGDQQAINPATNKPYLPTEDGYKQLFRYELIGGAGQNDNDLFAINDDRLVTRPSFDFEVRSIYSVWVQSTDRSGRSTQQAFMIIINNVNEAPTLVTMTPISGIGTSGSLANGTAVANLAAVDPDANPGIIYTLTQNGDSSDALDNAKFRIAGSQLVANADLTSAAGTRYSVRVTATDVGGLSVTAVFTLSFDGSSLTVRARRAGEELSTDSSGTGIVDATGPVSPTPSQPGNSGTAGSTVSAELVRMYRAYNPNANYHFFTTSKDEFESAIRAGYRDETSGQSGFAVETSPTQGSTPVFRLYNLQTGRHYYTTNASERDALVNLVPPPVQGPDTRQVGWRFEKSEGYLFDTPQPGTVEVYRLYNTDSGVHLYTESALVRDAVLAIPQIVNGVLTGQHPWQLQSQLGYAFPGTATSISLPVTAALVASPVPASNASENGAATQTTVSNVAEAGLVSVAAPVTAPLFSTSTESSETRSQPVSTSPVADDASEETGVDAVFAGLPNELAL